MPPPKTLGPDRCWPVSGPLPLICLQGLLLSGRGVLSGQPALDGFILPNGLLPGWLGSVPIPLHGEPWSLGTEPFLRNAETGEVARLRPLISISGAAESCALPDGLCPACRNRECPTLDGLEARSSGLTSVRDKRAQSTRRNHEIVLVNIQHDFNVPSRSSLKLSSEKPSAAAKPSHRLKGKQRNSVLVSSSRWQWSEVKSRQPALSVF
jgi:hypothetical protein